MREQVYGTDRYYNGKIIHHQNLLEYYMTMMTDHHFHGENDNMK